MILRLIAAQLEKRAKTTLRRCTLLIEADTLRCTGTFERADGSKGYTNPATVDRAMIAAVSGKLSQGMRTVERYTVSFDYLTHLCTVEAYGINHQGDKVTHTENTPF
jgi:hypothetical protein